MKDEYDILKETLQIEQEIQIEKPVQMELNSLFQENINSDITLEYVKHVKVAELQYKNKLKLEEGFDIQIDKNQTYHVSFTSTGLFNLISILINSNSEDKKYLILQKMNEFKQQCDSYCNSLIQQVKSAKNIQEVSNIYYEKEGDN